MRLCSLHLQSSDDSLSRLAIEEAAASLIDMSHSNDKIPCMDLEYAEKEPVHAEDKFPDRGDFDARVGFFTARESFEADENHSDSDAEPRFIYEPGPLSPSVPTLRARIPNHGDSVKKVERVVESPPTSHDAISANIVPKGIGIISSNVPEAVDDLRVKAYLELSPLMVFRPRLFSKPVAPTPYARPVTNPRLRQPVLRTRAIVSVPSISGNGESPDRVQMALPRGPEPTSVQKLRLFRESIDNQLLDPVPNELPMVSIDAPCGHHSSRIFTMYIFVLAYGNTHLHLHS